MQHAFNLNNRTMKPYFFILFFVLQVAIGGSTQQKSHVFEITNKEGVDKDIYVFYKDVKEDKYQGIPEFDSQTPVDLSTIITSFPSIKEISKIEGEIFTEEDLKNSGRILAICDIHIPSGKIVAVSFSTKNLNIDVKKLELYNKRIKEELKFGITLQAKLIKEGYSRKTFPVLTSLNKHKK